MFYTHAYMYIWHAPAYLCTFGLYVCILVCVCVCVCASTPINNMHLHAWVNMQVREHVSLCLCASCSVCESMHFKLIKIKCSDLKVKKYTIGIKRGSEIINRDRLR